MWTPKERISLYNSIDVYRTSMLHIKINDDPSLNSLSFWELIIWYQKSL